jgi:hypothetical protein
MLARGALVAAGGNVLPANERDLPPAVAPVAAVLSASSRRWSAARALD